MKMKQIRKFLLACCGILGTLVGGLQNADAHGGRRLDIQVRNNQLIAQGFNSGHDDGGGAIRPYHNAIHDHWSNVLGTSIAIATFPGFDIKNPSELSGESLVLELMGAKKWVYSPNPIETNSFVNLDAVEFIEIEFNQLHNFRTDVPDSHLIANNILANGHYHFDMSFVIGQQPTDTFYAIQWKLSAVNSSILDSDPIYTILAPDPANGLGNGPHYHQSAIALESFLGVTAIPEPGSASLLALLSLVGLQRGRRSAKA